MSKKLLRVLALLLTVAMLAASCGSGESADSDKTDTEKTETAATDEGKEESSEPEEEAEEAPAEEAEEEPAEEAAAGLPYGAFEDCSADEGGLNIGTLLPETGQLAFLGDPMIEAVNMAICDINQAGGINGKLVTLSRGDSGTDPDIAGQTVDRLLTSEGVNAIVGAAASGISGSVIEKITSYPAVQCSPSNTAAGLGVGGDDGYYFRTAPSDDLQAPALAELILGDGYTSVAFVPRSDDWGTGQLEYFTPAFEAGGGEIVYNTPYALEATSFDDVVADVIASGPDSIVVASFEEGAQIIRTLAANGAGPDVIPIYITDGLASSDLGVVVDDQNPAVVEGIRGTQPSAAPESGAAFFPAAFAEYAPEVVTIYSSQAYDCAALVALAAAQAGTNDATSIRDNMVSVSKDGKKCDSIAECLELIAAGEDIDYEGASGPIDFLDVGEPSVGSYDIYEYGADGLQEVQEQIVFTATSADAGDTTEEASAGLPYGAFEDCSADEGGLNIGTILPETGALAFLGDPMIEAVNMAICDINNAGGINGQLVTLSRGDSGTDGDIAGQTADRLLTSEGVNAIVGAAASGISGAIIEKVTSYPAVQCSPSNTAAGLGVGGDDGYYFRTAPSDDLQAPALAELVLSDGYTSVAFVPRSDDWGSGLLEYFTPVFEAGGGEIVYNTPYALEATSFDDVVADVIASGPDAIVLASFEEGSQIIRTLAANGAGPDVIPIYITDGLANSELGNVVDDQNPGIVEGIRGTAPSATPEAGAAFFPVAFAEYAPEVVTIFSAQAYDCAALVALAAAQAGSNDAEAIRDNMVSVSKDGKKCDSIAECLELIAAGEDIDYDGASGPIDFLDVGEPSVGAYDIYEYDADGLQQVQEQVVFDAN